MSFRTTKAQISLHISTGLIRAFDVRNLDNLIFKILSCRTRSETSKTCILATGLNRCYYPTLSQSFSSIVDKNNSERNDSFRNSKNINIHVFAQWSKYDNSLKQLTLPKLLKYFTLLTCLIHSHGSASN